jgi:hypothetical protein
MSSVERHQVMAFCAEACFRKGSASQGDGLQRLLRGRIGGDRDDPSRISGFDRQLVDVPGRGVGLSSRQGA